MNDRFNIDELGIFLVWMGIIVSVIAYFTNSSFLNVLGLAVFIWAIFRSFSSQKGKRAIENDAFKQKFLKPVKKSLRGFKQDTVGDKDHKYVTCPVCGQRLRIPKKKGKIKVKCPKCETKFDARS